MYSSLVSYIGFLYTRSFAINCTCSHSFWLHDTALPKKLCHLLKMQWRGTMSVYQIRGIAKRHSGNKQSTPTPRRYVCTPPSCRGVDTTSMSVLSTASSIRLNLAISWFWIKQKTLQKYVTKSTATRIYTRLLHILIAKIGIFFHNLKLYKPIFTKKSTNCVLIVCCVLGSLAVVEFGI